MYLDLYLTPYRKKNCIETKKLNYKIYIKKIKYEEVYSKYKSKKINLIDKH